MTQRRHNGYEGEDVDPGGPYPRLETMPLADLLAMRDEIVRAIMRRNCGTVVLIDPKETA